MNLLPRLGLLAALSPLGVGAITFTVADVPISLDSTLTAGASYRVSGRDARIISTSNGGTARSSNSDDGNLNYDVGFFSTLIKGTHDLEIEYNDFSVFVRGAWFYDYEQEEGERARRPLTDEAKDIVGSAANFLDYYVRGKFDIGGTTLELRGGSMVLSWGESTFIQNGVNVINPFDVARLRAPGSELREALLPVPMINATLQINDNLSLEAFYQLRWEETELDPSGSYFSTNDFAGVGGNLVWLGFGSISEASPFGAVSRAPDKAASDDGQFGAAVRLFAPALNQTEFGLYYVNYHSRLPIISAITPTTPINSNLTAPITTVLVGQGVPLTTAQQQASAIFGALVAAGGNVSALPAQQQAIVNGARQIAFLTSAATGRYQLEYPEDIQNFGVSFNTDLGGTSLQGEISYKKGQPLQLDDVELLFATLSAINPSFGPPNNQIGNFLGQLGRPIEGYRRHDVWQAQMTATRLFGRTLGADQMVIVIEGGATYVPNLEDRSTLRYDGPGTATGGSLAGMTGTGNGAFGATDADAFASKLSFGYQLAARLDYSNVLFGINASPLLAFAHDLSGVTPLPLGNFRRNRKTLTVGVELTFQNQWAADLRYTNYFGADEFNLLRDRDFVSASVKYSF